MRAKRMVCLLAVVSLIFFNGCASIVSKTVYPVTINSYPDGAKITIENEDGIIIYRGITPTTVSLKSGGFYNKKDYIVTFSKSGHEETEAFLRSTMDAWYIGNVIFGGLIGVLIVDPMTGAMWKLPDNLTVTLIKEYALKEKDIRIVSIDQIPDSMKDQLIRIN